jgi:pre-mRNA cleavage complex 2 protein Pcf11
LPAFYLLDAISKNVFDPYARHFTPIVVRLFLDTYEQVDQNTRSKMEEMLLTWRTGAPNGRELFGPIPQVAIERQIWGGESTQGVCGPRRKAVNKSNRAICQSVRDGQPPISSAQVLSELEFVLNTKQRALQSGSYDKQTHNQVQVLLQVCLLLMLNEIPI